MAQKNPIPAAIAAAMEAEAAAIAAVGRRGLAAMAEIRAEVGSRGAAAMPTKKACGEIARRHRRKGATIAAATAAVYDLPHADQAACLWRRARRRELQRGEYLGRSGARAPRSTAELRAGLDIERRYEIERFFAGEIARADISVTFGATRVSRANRIPSAEEPAVKVTHEDDWNGYSSSTKWPKRTWDIRVSAQQLLRREMPGGRRVIDGLCTLAAEQLPSPDGQIRLWRATWAAKRRGVDWSVESGYMAELGDVIAHGRTERLAVANVRRRMTAAQTEVLRATIQLSRQEALDQHGDVMLSWRHARLAGLCAEGITAWCAEHFPALDPRRGKITVRQALETRSSEYLVIRAVEQAVAVAARKAAA